MLSSINASYTTFYLYLLYKIVYNHYRHLNSSDRHYYSKNYANIFLLFYWASNNSKTQKNYIICTRHAPVTSPGIQGQKPQMRLTGTSRVGVLWEAVCYTHSSLNFHSAARMQQDRLTILLTETGVLPWRI